jgi:curli biogenesis system outer membrane secretion channel CsgG
MPKNRLPFLTTLLTLTLLLTTLTGCATPNNPRAEACVKPTIAVMKFENRAQFPLAWDLGGGTRDVLVDRLVKTDRYRVIERPEIDSILRELQFQQSGATRAHERAALGQLKNVQYLIKGTVTDFTHVSSASGFLSTGPLGLFGGSNRAVKAMTVYVVEVESGEIVVSQTVQESVSASDLNVKAVYKDVAFGGNVFYKTPLGEATAKVIDKAVAGVTQAIANRPWAPRVALVPGDGTVVLNGGADRQLKPGDQLELLRPGPQIIDPDNGDVLGRSADKVVGRLTVREVAPRYSIATLLDPATDCTVGQLCRPVATPGAR